MVISNYKFESKRLIERKKEDQKIETHFELTFPELVRVLVLIQIVVLAQLMQTEVGDLQNEARVDHTVRRLQIAMHFDLGRMQIRQTLDKRD